MLYARSIMMRTPSSCQGLHVASVRAGKLVDRLSLSKLIGNIYELLVLMAETVDDWDNIFSVNVRGTFLCYKYAARQMIKQGRGGRLIAASSLAGIVAENGMFAYGASKFAVRV